MMVAAVEEGSDAVPLDAVVKVDSDAEEGAAPLQRRNAAEVYLHARLWYTFLEQEVAVVRPSAAAAGQRLGAAAEAEAEATQALSIPARGQSATTRTKSDRGICHRWVVGTLVVWVAWVIGTVGEVVDLRLGVPHRDRIRLRIDLAADHSSQASVPIPNTRLQSAMPAGRGDVPERAHPAHAVYQDWRHRSRALRSR